MAEENQTIQQSTDATGTEAKPKISDAEAALLKENMSYKAKLRAFEEAESKRADEARKAADAEALKRGEHENIIKAKDAEIAAFNAREAKREEKAKARYEERIAKLPPDKLKVIQGKLDAIPVFESRLDQLDEYEALGLFGTQEPIDPLRNPKGSGQHQPDHFTYKKE